MDRQTKEEKRKERNIEYRKSCKSLCRDAAVQTLKRSATGWLWHQNRRKTGYLHMVWMKLTYVTADKFLQKHDWPRYYSVLLVLEAPEAWASDSKILLLQRKHFTKLSRLQSRWPWSFPPLPTSLSPLVRMIKGGGPLDEPGLKYCPKSQTDGSRWQQWPFEPIRHMGLDVWAMQRNGKRRKIGVLSVWRASFGSSPLSFQFPQCRFCSPVEERSRLYIRRSLSEGGH